MDISHLQNVESLCFVPTPDGRYSLASEEEAEVYVKKHSRGTIKVFRVDAETNTIWVAA